MAVTSTDLAVYIGGADGQYVADCLAQAVALVTAYVGDAEVPAVILDRATLETAAALHDRKNSPAPGQYAAGLDGVQPTPGPRDPMALVYPLLRRYLPGGFA